MPLLLTIDGESMLPAERRWIEEETHDGECP
jgi:hypothetical protein